MREWTKESDSAWMMTLLAGGMGLGAVLGYPQWRVLRRVIHGAWIWIPANCPAWAIGMPIIFAAIDCAYAACAAGSIAGAVAFLAGTLGLPGAAVGAVHGLALVKLADSEVYPWTRQTHSQTTP